MYKVFPVEGGHQVFWCPTEWQKVALAKIKIYPHASAAYRSAARLNKKRNDAAKAIDEEVKRDGAISSSDLMQRARVAEKH